MSNTKEIIKKYNIRLTKSLGQNFLNDDRIVENIVDAAGVGKDDLVIEIGPGAGSMTRELCKKAGKVVAVEIDKYLIPVLSETLKEFANLRIINEDVLKVDFGKDILDVSEEDFKPLTVRVVANLPYYITTPIIMKLLEENPGIDCMVFMVQKEVAQRMAASPGGKDYGALSVAVQYYSKPEKVFDVPPHCFIPQPEVDSTVIRLNILKTPSVEVRDKDIFFKTIKASFGQRRKTLVNALSNSGYFIRDKEEIKKILENIGIGENQRGETLSIAQFAQLANELLPKREK
ncbi:MAG: 16S rRNA (adenine(1518)-N(6)/adenine(1519)-N(6))-dimethyltransferase RsmA [Clostridia bacterium]|nr:16S rRNA (adenine(1518)-N(6)/adenine(1519)-N(6))-dimethyltransferase RsmA [Clostridia bacterium]